MGTRETHVAARSWACFALPVGMVLAHLVVYSLGRAGLYFAWPTHFAELDGARIASAFLDGTRFDLSIVALSLAPALVALVLPWRFAASRRWRAAWGWWGYATLVLAAGLLIGDACYFGLVHRHIGVELAALEDDVDLLVGMALRDYLPAVGALLGFGVLLAFPWRRLLAFDARRVDGRRAPWLAPLLLGAGLVLAIRGNVSGKPLGVVNAFESGSLAEGYLTLNGPFSVWHSSRNARPKAVEYLPWERAVELVQRSVFAPGERATSTEFPLQRTRPRRSTQATSGDVPATVSAATLGFASPELASSEIANPAPPAAAADGDDESDGETQRARPNVMVVLLESWDALAVDAIRNEHGLEPLGLTPRFDELARSGVLFTRFYAAGQRSMDGLSAVLCGFPTLPGMPYIGRGMEQSRLGFVGELARADGYATFFVQGSKRTSFRGDAIAALAGFDVYEGMEDIVERQGREPMADWGSWDDDLFAEAGRLARSARAPFLGYVFTTSTHPPFQIPSDEFARYPPDAQRQRYWNSIHYADWCIGRLVERARTEGWFDDTVWIFVADHTSGMSESDGTPASLHHIPCLVLAPGLAPRVERRISSQLDLVPTVVDVAELERPYAAFGRSLLAPETSPDHGAWCIRGNVVLRVEDRGWVVHNTKQRLEARVASETDAAAIEERLLAFLQVATLLLRKNQVYRVEVPPNDAVHR